MVWPCCSLTALARSENFGLVLQNNKRLKVVPWASKADFPIFFSLLVSPTTLRGLFGTCRHYFCHLNRQCFQLNGEKSSSFEGQGSGTAGRLCIVKDPLNRTFLREITCPGLAMPHLQTLVNLPMPTKPTVCQAGLCQLAPIRELGSFHLLKIIKEIQKMLKQLKLPWVSTQGSGNAK